MRPTSSPPPRCPRRPVRAPHGVLRHTAPSTAAILVDGPVDVGAIGDIFER
ncbi:MAG: hypothetical protein AAF772_21265 [Acidobacteriota bacterium]